MRHRLLFVALVIFLGATVASAQMPADVTTTAPPDDARGVVVRTPGGFGGQTPLGDSMIDETLDAQRVTVVSAVQTTKIIPESGGTLTHAGGQITSATTTTLVAGTANQTIKVFELIVYTPIANNITIQDSGGTNLVGTNAVFNLLAGGALVLELRADKHFNATGTGNGLQLITSSVGPVTWSLKYTKE